MEIKIGDEVLVDCPAFFKEKRFGTVVKIDKGLNHTLYGVAGTVDAERYIFFTDQEVQPYDSCTERQAETGLVLGREGSGREVGG